MNIVVFKATKLKNMMKGKERFYHQEGEYIVCHLCFRRCRLGPEKRGFCGVNENSNSQLTFLSYGRPAAMHCDPIEKKPLYHVRPGTSIFSIGTTGCGFTCPFCQNASLARGAAITEGRQYSNDEILDKVQAQDSHAIAFTYNEPCHSWLWYRDLAYAAKKRGMLTVMVTNGSMSPVVCEDMIDCIDAVNIDLKSGSNLVYREQLGGNRSDVIENIATLHSAGVWVELTTLLVSEMSDSVQDMQASANEIYDLVGGSIPWHLSAYYPAHQYRAPATPRDIVLQRCDQLRDHGFSYVYAGNIAVVQNTHCCHCQTVLISRQGYQVKNMLKDGACPLCLRPMEGLL